MKFLPINNLRLASEKCLNAFFRKYDLMSWVYQVDARWYAAAEFGTKITLLGAMKIIFTSWGKVSEKHPKFLAQFSFASENMIYTDQMPKEIKDQVQHLAAITIVLEFLLKMCLLRKICQNSLD